MDDVILNIANPHLPQKETIKPAISKYCGKNKRPQIVKFRNSFKNTKETELSEFSTGLDKTTLEEIKSNKKRDYSETSFSPDDSEEHNVVKKSKFVKDPVITADDKPKQDKVITLFKETVKFTSEPLFSEIKWESLGDKIHPHLIGNVVSRMEFTSLTQIQKLAIDPLLQLKDCLIKAQTGSGKTLAYLIPLLHHLMSIKPDIDRKSGLFALIILPTRELATQTYNVFSKVRYACVRIVCGLLQGGKNRKAEKATLRKGLNVVIGTPQRIFDHLIHTNSLNLAKIKWLVVDEADRLLEMNFEKDVREIVRKITLAKEESDETFTTVLLSATLNEGVHKLAGLLLKDPVKCYTNENSETINSSTNNDTKGGSQLMNISMPEGLRHYILKVPTKQKLTALASFILLKCRYNDSGGKVVIFLSTQDCVDFHHDLFQETLCSVDDQLVDPKSAGFLSLYRLHGNMDAKIRNKVFHEFSTCPTGLLLTTDVASRGLDLSDVSWVIQYQITGNVADYIHRTGRTARAGGRGKAVLILSPEEAGYADMLVHQTSLVIENLKLEDIYSTALQHLQNLKQIPFIDKTFKIKRSEDAVALLARLFINCVNANESLKEKSERALLSYLRSYASLSGDMRQFFSFKSLHIGHVAHSFALSDPPKDIASKVTGKRCPKEFKKFIPTEDRNKISQMNKKVNYRLELDETVKKQKEKFYNKQQSLKKVKPNDVAKRNMLAEYI